MNEATSRPESAPAHEISAMFATMFDLLADSYDQSGVPFFTTIAESLVRRLEPAAGERALDLGAGRGAATFPLAEGVGPAGHVDAIDIAPAMVALTTDAVRESGLTHVRLAVGDASEPDLAPASYDVLASSLALFFLPGPEAALERWRGLLVPGGRLGFSTFQPWPPMWQSIEDVFADYAEDPGRPGATEMPEVFREDAGVEAMTREAGFSDVRTETATYAIPFDNIEQWRVWSLGTAMRGLWMRAPQESHHEILRRVEEILASTRDDDGRSRLDVGVRYTLARA